MLTINAEIKKDGLRSNGTYNVKLRFTLDRKMRRVATSLFATGKDLTKDLKIKQNSPIKKEVDTLIRNYQEKCAQLQIELNHYTIDEVISYLYDSFEDFLYTLEEKYQFRVQDCCWMICENLSERSYI